MDTQIHGMLLATFWFHVLWFLTESDYVLCVYCNVADRRQTTHSSAYDTNGFPNGNSCNGVDGLPSQDFFNGTCVHTTPETDPWWEVDLGTTYTVDFINISVRSDNSDFKNYEQFSSVTITVDGNFCANYSGPPALSTIRQPITITCAPGAAGRYLKMLRQVSNDNFQFCEVEVFVDLTFCADPPGDWMCGSLCYNATAKTNTCPQSSATVNPGNTGTARSGDCMCPCASIGTSVLMNVTKEELLEQLLKIIDDIKIDPDQTSLAKSKLTSAEDNRPSAQAIGSMGVIALVAVVAIIVVMDLDRYIRGIKKVKKLFVKLRKMSFGEKKN
ncbi:uncharacterized protein LOC127702643 [Mytilus californianus]|uniref:uncharacterized protein LOC127702643 n=1 Tax=Mytilus californianus TaxID=6549 RepID=UPI002247928F|nr:uncharacterized protein LOC127702643 [Mytilus californianus]